MANNHGNATAHEKMKDSHSGQEIQRSLFEDGAQGVSNNYSTPHTKLGTPIGVEKAAGMGKVTRIGIKVKKK